MDEAFIRYTNKKNMLSKLDKSYDFTISKHLMEYYSECEEMALLTKSPAQRAVWQNLTGKALSPDTLGELRVFFKFSDPNRNISFMRNK
ncbi:MAG TPA: hypothetical protein PKA06_10200 [Gemmatales bacterium]|nr:hypothetical protein [Gemmatales bacterium]